MHEIRFEPRLFADLTESERNSEMTDEKKKKTKTDANDVERELTLNRKEIGLSISSPKNSFKKN